MENKDTLDIYTPTGGDVMYVIPPYIGNRLYGQPIHLNRLEEVAGSNPARSTINYAFSLKIPAFNRFFLLILAVR